MADKKGGFLALSRQGAMILALGSAIWCLMTGVTLLDTLFRAGVVYLAMVIISYIVSNTIVMNMVESEIVDSNQPPVESNSESPR